MTRFISSCIPTPCDTRGLLQMKAIAEMVTAEIKLAWHVALMDMKDLQCCAKRSCMLAKNLSWRSDGGSCRTWVRKAVASSHCFTL